MLVNGFAQCSFKNGQRQTWHIGDSANLVGGESRGVTPKPQDGFRVRPDLWGSKPNVSRQVLFAGLGLPVPTQLLFIGWLYQPACRGKGSLVRLDG